jgi:hypothetical protein
MVIALCLVIFICFVKLNGFVLSDVAGFQETYSGKIIETIHEEPQRREWMQYFSKACEHKKRTKYKVWQNGYHAEHIYSNKFARKQHKDTDNFLCHGGAN